MIVRVLFWAPLLMASGAPFSIGPVDEILVEVSDWPTRRSRDFGQVSIQTAACGTTLPLVKMQFHRPPPGICDT